MIAAAEHTLPDLLRDGLDIVFVGINPSLYSVAQGHYFARRANRFWPCFSRSVLSEKVRRALGVERLEPIHDAVLPDHGFGFTDLVKRPTANVRDLRPGELAGGGAALIEKLARYRPGLVCFHGVTILRAVAPALNLSLTDFALGPQPGGIGPTPLFVVPNPSPANAHFTPAQQTEWYDRLAACRERSLP
ncbi:MAG TPA: mismatch-specific DNA-glycosylase [Stellaceae bacterium]